MVSDFHNSPSQRVSVVVNVWGGDDPFSLKRSLSSIAAQRRSPDEVLVVIDGPISYELDTEIQEFKNGASFPIRTIQIASPQGLWNARNIGINEAEHEFIALHDADDVMHPDRLKIQLIELVRDEIEVLGSPVYEFHATNENILGLRSMAVGEQVSKKMLWQNVINHSTVMLRKSAITDVGGYRNIYFAEDYDLWLRLIIAGKNVINSEYILQAFSVDSQLEKRRGGRKFISSEIALHQLIRSTGSQNFFISWLRLLLRVIFRLGPKLLRKTHRAGFQTIRIKSSTSSLPDFLSSPPQSINLTL